jgi:hypothetical protein
MRAYKSLTDRSFILDKFAADDLYFPHENEEYNGGIIEVNSINKIDFENL